MTPKQKQIAIRISKKMANNPVYASRIGIEAKKKNSILIKEK